MAKSLQQIMDEWNKDSGCVVVQKGIPEQNFKRIPFSSATANYMTYGGMPRGKAVEFFGPEGSGKTTSASKFPGALVLAFEKGYNAIPGIMAKPMNSWNDFKERRRNQKVCT